MKYKLLIIGIFLTCTSIFIWDVQSQPNRQSPARSIFSVSVNPLACKENEIFYNMTTHQFLVCTGVNTLSVVSFGGGGGGSLASLNGLSASIQSFTAGSSGTNFNIASSGSTHTFNIPTASGINRGLLSSSDWLIFNNKQPALGFTPESLANKNALNGYAGLSSGKLTASQATELLSITDLTDYSLASGTGTTAIKATFTSLTTNDCLLWDGTNWVNSNTCASGATGITSLNTLSAASQTFATGTSGSDFAISSTSSTHTFNIPSASVSNRGLLLAADWTTFNNKQAALGFTPEDVTNKNAANGYAGLSSGKITLSQISEVLGIGDLSDFTGKSGTGTTSIGATITSIQVNDCLVWDGAKWINSASCGGGGGGSGITNLNGLTSLSQTFAVGTSGTNFNISSSGSAHTFNIPIASSTATGLLSSANWTIFNNKQNALGFTPENSANKNATNGYAGLSSGKLSSSQMTEVIGISGLSDFSSKSGIGTTAIGATLTGLTTNDCLKWSGTDWINSTCGSGGGDMFLANVQTITGAKTFNAGTLIVGTFAGLPSVTANSFYRNTSDGKLYVGSNDGTAWNELMEANVSGPISNINGGKGIVGSGSSVASAATISATGGVFHVIGTTTITSVSGTGIQAGTQVTIIFDNVLTFTDGSNLKLNGNFVTTADDTITLTYDGTSWFEVSRSVN